MEPTTKSEDELQKAINNIADASGGGGGTGLDAVAAVTNKVASSSAAPGGDGAGIGGTNEVPDVTMADVAPGAMGAVDMSPETPDASVAAPEVSTVPEVSAVPEVPVAPEVPMPPAMGGMGPGGIRASYGDPDLGVVKVKALTDLRPLVEKVDLSPESKFKIYQEIILATHDKAALEPAYEAATGIAVEKSKAEALLFIVETIDQLGIGAATTG